MPGVEEAHGLRYSGLVDTVNGIAIGRDDAGRIDRLVYGPGKEITYRYDNRGFLAEVSDWIGGTTSMQYDETGKIQGEPEGVRWQRRSTDYRPTPTFIADVQELEFTHPDAFEAWTNAGRDRLAAHEAGDDQTIVAEFIATKLLRRAPIASTAHLASGSFVVASKPFAEFIRETNANIHAGEMEAAGMMAAAEYAREPVQTLVLRGISDHVDADKERADAIGDGALRQLAMDNAWHLLCLMMELEVLPRNGAARAESQLLPR
mgnify:CR=1 FL=1